MKTEWLNLATTNFISTIDEKDNNTFSIGSLFQTNMHYKDDEFDFHFTIQITEISHVHSVQFHLHSNPESFHNIISYEKIRIRISEFFQKLKSIFEQKFKLRSLFHPQYITFCPYLIEDFESYHKRLEQKWIDKLPHCVDEMMSNVHKESLKKRYDNGFFILLGYDAKELVLLMEQKEYIIVNKSKDSYWMFHFNNRFCSQSKNELDYLIITIRTWGYNIIDLF